MGLYIPLREIDLAGILLLDSLTLSFARTAARWFLKWITLIDPLTTLVINDYLAF